MASCSRLSVDAGVLGGAVLGGALTCEAGPDVVGETADGQRSLLPADMCEHGTVWGPGHRWVVSWMVSLSRAVFWKNKQMHHQMDTYCVYP